MMKTANLLASAIDCTNSHITPCNIAALKLSLPLKSHLTFQWMGPAAFKKLMHGKEFEIHGKRKSLTATPRLMKKLIE